MKITCAFQYELYVDETRRAALSRNAGCRRFVFNKALGIQNERKSKGEKLLTYKELAHELVLWKKQPETAFLREAMAQPLQQALLDLDRAISDSFRPKSDPAHKGWPKFKAKDIGDGFRVRSLLQNTSTMPTGESSSQRSVGFDTAERVPSRSSVRTGCSFPVS